MIQTHHTKDEVETLEIAAALAENLKPGAIIALTGELGTGKTVFAKGIAHALGVKEKVTSPTFTLINEYHGDYVIYHMDFYRLNSLKEIVDIGVEDFVYGHGICFIEWAEKMGEMLPDGAIRVSIKYLKNNHREINIERPDEQ